MDDDFIKTLELNTILDNKLLDSLKYSYHIKKIIKEDSDQVLNNDNFDINTFLNDNLYSIHHKIFDNDDILDIINEYLGYKFNYNLYLNIYSNNSNSHSYDNYSNSSSKDMDDNHRKSINNSYSLRNNSMSNSKIPFLHGR